MGRFLVIFLWIVLVCNSSELTAQVEVRVGEVISCGITTKVNHNVSARNVESPDVVANQQGRTKNGEPIFEVKYSGFTEEARAAFQYAIDIWEANMQSDVKVRIFANWAFVENINTLAFVTPTEVKNFDGAPIRDLWYPVSLAEKLARKDINPTTEADIVATFNNRRTDWYLGTDGNCPSDKLDLVTVVLHEIGHGLGFSGTFRVNNSIGAFGLNDGRPKIYDTYLRNGFNQSILDFPNNSIELGTQLTSNSIVFNSPVARTLAATSANPRVYAPNPYAPGSSISHLDEGTYEDTPNSLMTPFASYGKVAHSPGPLVRGIFYEMGWLNTFIDHTELGDRESADNISFEVSLQKDTTINEASVTLHYSFDDFVTEATQVLSSTDEIAYESAVSLAQTDRVVKYFFTVQDILGRDFRLPLLANEYFSFYVGQDIVPPVIIHTAPESILPIDETLAVVASVTDNIGIKEVIIEYRLNENGVVQTMLATAGLNNSFSATIDLLQLGIVSGDKVFYRIRAVDNSSNENSKQAPTTGFFEVTVRTFEPTMLYVDDFSTDNQNFFGDFSITQPVGFTNKAIHSPHPYPKSGSTDELIELTYSLLIPIVVDAVDSYIAFDEVVLIEPGTVSDYLNPSFGDYVIVEGTKTEEINWTPLLNGYDSRTASLWLTYYNSSITNGDSRATGTLNYYLNRQIDLLEAFEPNDEILIRFKLVSDSQNAGWGWAIDNLTVQQEIVSVDRIREEKKVLYPNPAKSRLFSSNKLVSELTVYSADGRRVTSVNQSASEEGFDIESLPRGLFLVRYSIGGKFYTEKIIRE